MSIPRISQLKSILTLERKRAGLQSKIDDLDEKIAKVQQQLYSGSGQPRGVPARKQSVSSILANIPKALKVPKVGKTGKTGKTGNGRRGRHGILRQQILDLLAAAGPEGMAIRDLAARIGTKPGNISSWFSTNKKTIGNLKKTGVARFALNGSGSQSARSATSATSATSAKPAQEKKTRGRKATKATKASKAKAIKAPKAVKATKVAKPGKVGRPPGSKGRKAGKPAAKRGELKDQILSELKKAGENGISIKDLAEKTGTKYKNLYIWFVTTGKRVEGLEKVGPARYRLKAA